MASCQEDENCLSMNVAGTYEGSKECDEMDEETIAFDVTAGNSDIQIIVDGITTQIDDCDIFGSTVINGNGREIDGDIDGNKISFIETHIVNGDVDFRCVWEGTKQ